MTSSEIFSRHVAAIAATALLAVLGVAPVSG